MSLDPKEVVIPVIVQGEDKSVTIKLTQKTNGPTNGYPFDLTGATEIEAIFLKTDGTCLHKKLSLAQIVILNALAGSLQVLLTAADTALLAVSPANMNSNIELRVVIAGKMTYIQLKNVIKIVSSLYPVGC